MYEKDITQLIFMNFGENVTSLFCFAAEKAKYRCLSFENLNLRIVLQCHAIPKEMVIREGKESEEMRKGRHPNICC